MDSPYGHKYVAPARIDAELARELNGIMERKVVGRHIQRYTGKLRTPVSIAEDCKFYYANATEVEWIPDPAGYILVKPNSDDRRIDIGFCGYKELNVVKDLVQVYFEEPCMGDVYSGPITHAYITALGHGLVSRFDHAAYLGKELMRAAEALKRNEVYVQDGISL